MHDPNSILTVSLELSVKACLELMGAEELDASKKGVVQPHMVTASRFLATGIELQEQQ